MEEECDNEDDWEESFSLLNNSNNNNNDIPATARVSEDKVAKVTTESEDEDDSVEELSLFDQEFTAMR
jgi:hypothetical protein